MGATDGLKNGSFFLASEHPYYRRSARSPNRARDFASAGDRVDLSKAKLPDYGAGGHLSPNAHYGAGGDLVAKARSLFDARGAACVSAAVAIQGQVDSGAGPVRIWPAVVWNKDRPTTDWFWARDLLELKWYNSDADTIYILTGKCLPALAYLDFFPDETRVGVGLRTMVSAAVLAAGPGWCGTWGPDMESFWDVPDKNPEGNYDMTQMRLLHMAYHYYDVLSQEARDRLITVLLAHGRIDRINLDDTLTSGRAPNDWDRAGYISPGGPTQHTDIGETENHILMIATVRYLTNQLLFQRTRDPQFDNRRNGGDDDDYGAPCTSILLTLLRNLLRDDFSEYNAKNYQEETRWALLNLCTYAYDDEVRLAAQMVLDYVSAHVAVSTNDLRRMVPFRRRLEWEKVNRNDNDSMTVALLEGWPNAPSSSGHGADPIGKYFAVQAGNVRAFKVAAPDRNASWEWGIPVGLNDPGGLNELAMEVLSDYRLPHSIHDLFVSDTHRRFYQRLHRIGRNDADEVMGGNHNCDNMEIYAGSPSYLITAGGSPCGYAIDPHIESDDPLFGLVLGQIVFGKQDQQLGVAVTTSLMPTGTGDRVGNDASAFGVENDASALIQFSQFAKGGEDNPPRNYGVAPDFACGHNLYLPPWTQASFGHEGYSVGQGGLRDGQEGFFFLHRGPMVYRGAEPGCYLAIFQSGRLAVLEAFDTWLSPGTDFDHFCTNVRRANQNLRVQENEWFVYTTQSGKRVYAVIWSSPAPDDASPFGAEVGKVEYGEPATRESRQAFSWDAIGDASKVTERFLNGTVLNSPAEAVVEITNPALGTKLTLDMRDRWHPRRTAESGAVEEAGNHHEVWLDFDWRGPSEGDVCQPFKTVVAAANAVAEGGVVKIVPGTTPERSTIGATGRFTLVAPIGGVIIGARDPAERIPTASGGLPGENVKKDDIWVEFDFPDSNKGNAPGRLPLNTLVEAGGAVADGGIIRIVPGATRETATIGRGKRFTLSAPLGQVTIGAR